MQNLVVYLIYGLFANARGRKHYAKSNYSVSNSKLKRKEESSRSLI